MRLRPSVFWLASHLSSPAPSLLLLITNRKSHMGFQLKPTSVSLNDLERRNSFYFAFLSLNSIALWANYFAVVEDRPIISVKYCLPVPLFPIWP